MSQAIANKIQQHHERLNALIERVEDALRRLDQIEAQLESKPQRRRAANGTQQEIRADG